ncbi:PAS domain S-box protein [Candidatus Woesebacteria bacterium]|nr:PAS domain S-box protein [Candidatus Woesebacteria bacterium]
MRNRFLDYFNPISRLGTRQYSFRFPFIATLFTILCIELIVNVVLQNPDAVGFAAIIIFVFYIMYFAFRDGIKGGVIVSFLTIAYYGYIIYSRQYRGEQLISSIETTAMLGVLYLLLAGTIGWLKQTIDTLIEQEANAKRRLEAIVEQLPVGVIICNADGKYTNVNKQVERILGIPVPLGSRAGMTPLVRGEFNGRPISSQHSQLYRVLSSGKPIIDEDFMIERDDGRKVFVRASAAPIHNRKGKIFAAACIFNDITPQKELEVRKDDFVNMASHELKTPITSLKLYIDSLQIRMKDSKDERLLKTLSSIKYQTERLQKLVADLLDVSRLQTGKLLFNKEAFDLDTLLFETIEQLQGTTKHVIVYKGKEKLLVEGDKFRIYQVLTNLLTNALKYSGESTQIQVRLQKVAGKAVISVKDFGIGIEKDQQKKIFERLYQVMDDTEKTFPGFGMGLYISKEIVKRHKGSIWVESEKGKGSTFYFSIPIKS